MTQFLLDRPDRRLDPRIQVEIEIFAYGRLPLA